MKKKVYLSIFISLILAMFVTAAGSIFGEKLTNHLRNETIETALGGRSIADVSKEEADSLMRSLEFAQRLVAIEEEVSGKYWWLVGANFLIQFLLIILICFVCGKFVIHVISKHGNQKSILSD